MKITYELARKLKDAGFPQKGDNWAHSHEHDRGQYLYFPHLGELIEACGEDFFFLHLDHQTKEWVASGWLNDTQKNEAGPTPEEAVANLYLALNSK